MTTYEEIKQYMDRSDYRRDYEAAYNAQSYQDQERTKKYDEFVEELANIIDENNGDIDDAVAYFDLTLSTLQEYAV